MVLNIFNSQDNNLQFTFKVQHNNQINFLDLSLIIKENKIIFNWFQKPTSSNRSIKYFSNHPILQRVKIVYNLVDQAISLSYKTFHDANLKNVKQILSSNDYPNNFIDKNIKIRMNKIKYSSPNSLNKKNRSYLYRHQPKVWLPYNLTNFTKLSNIFRKYNISTIPVVNKTLKSIIKLGKDSTKKWEQYNIVYKFNCKNCPATHIGESKRALRVRINEHKNETNSESVVCEHQLEFNHEFDWENTKIVDYASDYRKR